MPPLKNKIYEASILLISKAVVNIKFIAVAGHVVFVCDVLEVTVVTCTETLTTGNQRMRPCKAEYIKLLFCL